MLFFGKKRKDTSEKVSARELDKKRLKKLKVNKERKYVRRRKGVAKTSLQTLPYYRVADDTIIEVTPGKYSKTYIFEDVNYQIASQEDQEDIFLRYCSVLNSFDMSVDVQVTIMNTRVKREYINDRVLLKMKNDNFDEYRKEYNEMLLEKISQGQNENIRTKLITISLQAENVEDARNKFMSFDISLNNNFKQMKSKLTELDSNQRIGILKDIFRGSDVSIPTFNYYDFLSQNERGYIAPDYFEFKNDYFMFNDSFARCVFIREYPSALADRLISDLTDTGLNMILTINIAPVDPGESLKIVKKQLSAMEQNRIDYQKRAARTGYSPDIVPLELRHSIVEAEELLDDLQSKNQKMFLVNVIIMHMASSYDELQQQSTILAQTARKYLVNIRTLKYQQEDAMASVLPLGNCKLKVRRTLTTESTAVLMPFSTQELIEPNGFYYGINAVSRNLIMFNRSTFLKNPNGFFLGSPGSGKSFAAKREIINIFLNTDDDVIIIDPEREYPLLVENFGGEIIEISAGSKNHINPLDMTKDYADDENPIILKSEFILSLCDLLVGGHSGLTAIEKAIIDRCVRLTYHEYMQSFDPSKIPTLKDFHRILKQQNEQEAHNLALSLELYTTGSLSIFSNKTNVDLNNRFIAFDTKDLGTQLKTLGMLIVLDAIWNRVTRNRAIGKRTWIYSDEIHLFFANEYSANFYFELYKRARKWGAIPTGITQNVEDLLLSDLARRMLSNSDFIMMLNQSASDRAELANLLNISDNQLSYVTNSDEGQGLLFIGNSIIPFVDKFPTNTKLYTMMTTKLDEVEK